MDLCVTYEHTHTHAQIHTYNTHAQIHTRSLSLTHRYTHTHTHTHTHSSLTHIHTDSLSPTQTCWRWQDFLGHTSPVLGFRTEGRVLEMWGLGTLPLVVSRSMGASRSLEWLPLHSRPIMLQSSPCARAYACVFGLVCSHACVRWSVSRSPNPVAHPSKNACTSSSVEKRTLTSQEAHAPRWIEPTIPSTTCRGAADQHTDAHTCTLVHHTDR